MKHDLNRFTVTSCNVFLAIKSGMWPNLDNIDFGNEPDSFAQAK